MKLKLITASLMSLTLSSMAWAVTPFTIQDIRVEGLQRTEPATVFSYLPVKIGDQFNDVQSEQIIKNLYATGFFDDVRVETSGNQVLLTVIERPVISSLNVSGGKSLGNDAIKKNMDRFGLGQSRVFDQAALNQAVEGLRQEYLSRGKNTATVTPTVTKLDRNRVAIEIAIDEGATTKIDSIDFVGNEYYSDSTLRRQMSLTDGGLMTWLTKSNQFSEEKMARDMEKVRDFYHNRGFFEFKVDGTKVDMSEDKKKMFVTINVTEGPRYRWGDVDIQGDIREVPLADLQKLTRHIKKGKVYEREQMVQAVQAVQERMGEAGYAFSSINVLPQPHRDTGVVDFTLQVDAGRKVYVNQINISGNNKTRDEVVRRELRQMEAAVFDSKKIQRSKERVELLGYFDNVKVDATPVENTPDQVDLNVNVTERATGSIEANIGYVQGDGMIFGGAVSQDNLFGTGKSINARISTGGSTKVASLSFTDPYFTPDGVSLGYDAFWRVYNPHKAGTSNYKTETYGAGVRMGVPITEYDRINFGIAPEQMKVTLFDGAPKRYTDFVNEYGNSNWTLKGNVGRGRNKTYSALWPTRGYIIRAGLEAGLPGGDIQYYSLSHQQTWFFPLSRDFTLMLNGEVGYADGYGKTKQLPFFHNFYVGGLGSVRGYDSSSLGPKYKSSSGNDYLGGNKKAVVNAELLFPMPGMRDQRSVRLSLFADAGSVWDGKTYTPAESGGFYQSNYQSTFSNELRYSAGAALTWISPLGPMKFSYAYPLNKKDGDQLQRFQFQLGTTF